MEKMVDESCVHLLTEEEGEKILSTWTGVVRPLPAYLWALLKAQAKKSFESGVDKGWRNGYKDGYNDGSKDERELGYDLGYDKEGRTIVNEDTELDEVKE